MSETQQIADLVRTSIETKIIEAFRTTPEMVDDLVRACLSQEVNGYGGKPDYHSRDKMPYLTYLARDAVQAVAATAVREYVAEMEPAIRDQVRSSLQAADVTDAFTRSIIATTSQDWKINVQFERDADG